MSIGKFEDASRGAMDAVVLVALSGIAPVEDEETAIGTVGQVDAAKPGIGGERGVGFVPADVAGAFTLEPLNIHAPAVEVEGEQLAAVRLGPLVGKVDGKSAMGMPSAAPLVFGV